MVHEFASLLRILATSYMQTIVFSFVMQLFHRQNLKEILLHYEHTFGQAIKYGKSVIAFSVNTSANAILTSLSVSNTFENNLYLGLPSMVGHNK